MSKYSNVNYSSILETTNKAINEISINNLDNIKNNLNNKSYLNSSISSNLNDNIDLIISSNTINGSIINLNNKLTTLKSSMNLIKKIQVNEEKINDLTPYLYYYDKVWYNTYDEYGNISGSDYYKVKKTDYSVKNSIESLKTEITNLEGEIDNLLEV